MANEIVAQIARTVLYEGYILWPYRRSAIKNQQRWTFGGIYPSAFAASTGGADRSSVCADVLLELPVDFGHDASSVTVNVSLRFLHVVARQVVALADDHVRTEVSELTVGSERYLSWDETTEHEITLSCDAATANEMITPVSIPAGATEELLHDVSGRTAGAIVRRWTALDATVTVGVEAVDSRPALRRITTVVRNDADWHGTAADREDAVRYSLLSAHVVLQSDRATFVSTIDPPADLSVASAHLHNDGLWPTLVGIEPDRHTVLASPIILGDYPRIAPESPGDLFDGGEIDQLLILNVLTLTEEEQAEMRDTDPRAREILDRCRRLSPEALMRLHATVRSLHSTQQMRSSPPISHRPSPIPL